MAPHYKRPGWLTQNVFNRIVARLTRLGLSIAGSRVLEVRGRTSGEPRAFFEGTGADSSDEELRRIAPKHPIFKIHART